MRTDFTEFMKSDNKTIIPLSVPVIQGNEWRYIKECLDTGWVSSVGSYVSRFEKQVAIYSGTKYSVALVNGTAALHLSLLACGVCPDDEVIVPALTFIAPVNVVRYCRAYPVFMDCDAETLCIDVGKIANFLKRECIQNKDSFTCNKKSKRRIKAIIPVHIFGHPADMDVLCALAEKYNITLIEDAAESLGSEYKGKKTGSFGAMGCFSFNGNKIITTGGGGMVVTDDEYLADKVRHLSTQAKKDPFEYDHDEIGYNYRLTNIHSAMGVAQMEKLEELITIKRQNASLYKDLLSGIKEVYFFWEDIDVKSNFWFYTIKTGKEHKRPLIEYLLARNIQVRPIWKLLHTLPMYRDYLAYKIERAVDAYEGCINLPCSVSLTKDDIKFIVESIKKYFRRWK